MDFFNTHYELYGRKIALLPSSDTASAAATSSTANYEDPSVQQADAADAASLKPFAATDYEDGVNSLFTAALPDYLDTLARHGVITVSGGTLPPITGNLDKHAPYEWSTQPTTDQVLAASAGLVCRQLKGHPAAHANAYRSTTRKFGLLFPDSASSGGGVPGQQAFLSALAGCGITKPPIVYFSNAGSSTLSASFVKLRSEGVTSLLFLPHLRDGTDCSRGGGVHGGLRPGVGDPGH